jgi:hypothetical protein
MTSVVVEGREDSRELAFPLTVSPWPFGVALMRKKTLFFGLRRFASNFRKKSSANLLGSGGSTMECRRPPRIARGTDDEFSLQNS